MACSSSPQKFVADGVFFAELNDVLTRELAEVRVSPMRIEITIRAIRYQNILVFLKFPLVCSSSSSSGSSNDSSSSSDSESGCSSGSDSDADDAELRG